ncbi:MAG: PIG-L family deacetylase [Vampirovibrio sp.]
MIKKLKHWFFAHMILRVFKLYFRLNLKPLALDLSLSKVLVLAPHPDDESIGMGGTLALFPTQCEVICLSHGEKGLKSEGIEEVQSIRQSEFEEAMRLSGVKQFSYLNMPDQGILTHLALFKRLDFSAYDYIFAPNILDQHKDHKAVALHLYHCLKEACSAKEDLKIAFYEVWNTHPLPNAFVDISTVVDLKKAMIQAHASQVSQKAYTSKMLALNAYRGLQRDLPYAEAFCIVDLLSFNEMVEAFLV